MMEAMMELLHQVGKLALREGEAWRLENVELMDAYNSALAELAKTQVAINSIP